MLILDRPSPDDPGNDDPANTASRRHHAGHVREVAGRLRLSLARSGGAWLLATVTAGMGLVSLLLRAYGE